MSDTELNFDSFYVTFGGVGDDGYHKCHVTIGFSKQGSFHRQDVEVPVRLKADLGTTLRSLREQVKTEALVILQKAVETLETHSTDELQAIALTQYRKSQGEVLSELFAPE